METMFSKINLLKFLVYLNPLLYPYAYRLTYPLRVYQWLTGNPAQTPPAFIKRNLLLHYSTNETTWVETGTYLGYTTKLLATKSAVVHTIEPSTSCLSIARQNCKGIKNIVFHNGTSESCCESIICSLSGDVCFWLDAHFSRGVTHCEQGTETPISMELSLISDYIERFDSISVFIDDAVCSIEYPNSYPSLNSYVEWANSLGLTWYLSNDIFIAMSKASL